MCVLCLQLYIQARFTWPGSKLLRHLIQALVVYLAVWCGLSRISDYKHHWSDVLAGAINGSLIACLTVSQFLYSYSYLTAVDNIGAVMIGRYEGRLSELFCALLGTAFVFCRKQAHMSRSHRVNWGLYI